MSRELEQIRTFEKESIKAYDPAKRPSFHLTGVTGWINDPNGFSWYGDEAHLFYQANPFGKEPGQICWGHAVTKDFVHWTYLPCAMAPSESYDADGCFSGSALTLPDGRHLLMYTGNRKTDAGEYRQIQCLAVGDGTDYRKYEKNPVLSSEDVPDGGSVIDFRDPKILEEDGRYKALVANRAADGTGAILVYESEDAFSWRYGGTLLAGGGRLGKMWECPDLFSLDGTDILLFSVQMIRGDDPAFSPGHGAVWTYGRYEKDKNRFLPKGGGQIDHGIDFYAPQTLLLPDGRRIMTAWMQNWETCGCCREDLDFNGQMIFPREITFRDGKLLQEPVRELETLYGARTAYEEVRLEKESRLPGIGGRTIDLKMTLQPAEGSDRIGRTFITLAAKDNIQTMLEIDPELSRVCVDRTRSGSPYDIVNRRTIPVRFPKGEIKLRVLLDRFSMELFVNEGEQAASFLLGSPEGADEIRFASDGNTLLCAEQHTIRGTVPEHRFGAE